MIFSLIFCHKYTFLILNISSSNTYTPDNSRLCSFICLFVRLVWTSLKARFKRSETRDRLNFRRFSLIDNLHIEGESSRKIACQSLLFSSTHGSSKNLYIAFIFILFGSESVKLTFLEITTAPNTETKVYTLFHTFPCGFVLWNFPDTSTYTKTRWN